MTAPKEYQFDVVGLGITFSPMATGLPQRHALGGISMTELEMREIPNKLADDLLRNLGRSESVTLSADFVKYLALMLKLAKLHHEQTNRRGPRLGIKEFERDYSIALAYGKSLPIGRLPRGWKTKRLEELADEFGVEDAKTIARAVKRFVPRLEPIIAAMKKADKHST